MHLLRDRRRRARASGEVCRGLRVHHSLRDHGHPREDVGDPLSLSDPDPHGPVPGEVPRAGKDEIAQPGEAVERLRVRAEADSHAGDLGQAPGAIPRAPSRANVGPERTATLALERGRTCANTSVIRRSVPFSRPFARETTTAPGTRGGPHVSATSPRGSEGTARATTFSPARAPPGR